MKFDIADCLQITKSNVLIKYSDDTIKKLAKLDKVCDQAEGALHIIYNENCSDKWSQRSNVDKNEKMKLCLLRCSLSEIVGIEDALRKYYISDKVFHLYDTKDPIIHFIRELRNFEIHIKETNVFNYKAKVTYAGEIVKDNGQEVTISFDCIRIDFESLTKLKNYNRYTEEQWKFMKEEFDKLQMDWGYQEVIISAVEKYCEKIVEHYKL